MNTDSAQAILSHQLETLQQEIRSEICRRWRRGMSDHSRTHQLRDIRARMGRLEERARWQTDQSISISERRALAQEVQALRLAISAQPFPAECASHRRMA